VKHHPGYPIYFPVTCSIYVYISVYTYTNTHTSSLALFDVVLHFVVVFYEEAELVPLLLEVELLLFRLHTSAYVSIRS
jgi:hypothetical protein